MKKEKLVKQLSKTGRELFFLLKEYQKEQKLPWELPNVTLKDGKIITPPLCLKISAFDTFVHISLSTTSANEDENNLDFKERKKKGIEIMIQEDELLSTAS